ncbi:GTPase [[Mycoplasma] testudinis]|uniref:GTPase n=1 Tax=[Mycoplasma] testudinis TaxID=33924 RepID=UPI0004864173|nr:GTPase [[Mycoplasma] testudinis]
MKSYKTTKKINKQQKTKEIKTINKKCGGCGAILSENQNDPGFTPVINKAILCQRCFQIKHYGKTKIVDTVAKSSASATLKDFQYEKNALFYVCDLSSIPFEVKEIKQLAKQAKAFYLVISKIDLIVSTKNWELLLKRLFTYVDRLELDLDDSQIIFTSVKQNLNYLQLQNALYQVSQDHLKACFVGLTNSGKSSIINWILKRERINHNLLVTSPFLNTTQGLKQIKTRDFTLIDVPGVQRHDTFQSLMSMQQLKNIVGINTIKPKTFQLTSNQLFIGENLLWCELELNDATKGSATFYFSQNLKVHKSSIKNSERLKLNHDKLFGNKFNSEKLEFNQYWFTSQEKQCFLVLYGLGIISLKNIKSIKLEIPNKIIKPIFFDNAKI